MNRTVRIIGYGIVGFMLGGVLLVAVLAAMRGEQWLWRNYWNASIATWGIISTFGLMGVIGVVWLGQRAWRAWKASRPPP